MQVILDDFEFVMQNHIQPEILDDSEFMHDCVLRLNRLPPENQAHEAFRSFFELIWDRKPHKALDQSQLIKKVAGFLPWEVQWCKLRLVSSIWRDVIETHYFRDVELKLEINRLVCMPEKLLSRFLRIEFTSDLIKNPLGAFGESSFVDTRGAKLVRSFQECPLEAIVIRRRFFDPIKPSKYIDALIENARKSLKTLEIGYPYTIPSIEFLQLQSIQIQCEKGLEEEIHSVISVAQSSNVMLLKLGNLMHCCPDILHPVMASSDFLVVSGPFNKHWMQAYDIKFDILNCTIGDDLDFLDCDNAKHVQYLNLELSDLLNIQKIVQFLPALKCVAVDKDEENRYREVMKEDLRDFLSKHGIDTCTAHTDIEK